MLFVFTLIMILIEAYFLFEYWEKDKPKFGIYVSITYLIWILGLIFIF